jgi:hypothetical protein
MSCDSNMNRMIENTAMLTLNTRGPQGHVGKSVASEVRVVS